tara:strand:- start:85 stop:360 length:276 start_codon:yes stop_codon:yes gene_type:complete
MSSNSEEIQQVSISKDALTILVQLVQLAQKKGAYSLDESYLAFNAINTIVDEPKFKKTAELVKNLFSSNIQKAPVPSQDKNETVVVNNSNE